MTTLTNALPAHRRLRAGWAAAHGPVAGVPRWARIAAYAIPFTVLPSGIWRIASVTFGLGEFGDIGERGRGGVPSWLPLQVYVIILSVVAELLAFAATGLIARWGEVFPRWLPGLRGRRIPTLTAVVPAASGAVILTLLWTWSAGNLAVGRTIQGDPLPADAPLNVHDWQGLLAIAAYAPLLLWGPLLGALTVAYARRRRARRRR